MVRNLFELTVLVLFISSCSDKAKMSKEETEVIFEQEIAEEETSGKEVLKSTIQSLHNLNKEQETNLELSKRKPSEETILEERSNKADLKNTIKDLEKLNENKRIRSSI